MILTGDLEISQRKVIGLIAMCLCFRLTRSAVLFSVLVFVFTDLTQVRVIQEEGPLTEKMPP